MDLAQKVQFFTLDVISGVGLGTSFGMLRTDSDIEEYAKSTEQGLIIGSTALALGLSWLTQVPFLGRLIAPSPKDASGFGKVMATCFRHVDERASSRSTHERSDMLASFIRHGLSDDALRSEALEQIVAGSDTTSGAIRGILLLLLTNYRVYDKLKREIDEAERDGRVPSRDGDGQIISLRQARQLPYLQAVIREGIRVLPPVTNLFSRDVPPDGDEVPCNGEKIFLPGGVCIGQSSIAMHRSRDIFGDDAHVFRPERWFEADEEKLAVMTRTNDLMFGAGRWSCLGKPVAQLEVPKLIFEVHSSWC